MAEYCSNCSPYNNQFDIDLTEIALKLEKGYSTNILCEGCNIRAVYKDENGVLYLGKLVENALELKPVRIEELMG